MTHRTEDQSAEPAASATVNLPQAAAELLEAAGEARAGRAARTLVPGAGAVLKQTLVALLDGRHLADHETPAAATLLVLVGAVRITGGPEDIELGPGDHTPIPPVRHGLHALADAVVLISVGGTPSWAGPGGDAPAA